MNRNYKSKGDVCYYVPGKKRPIAYSTRAASDIIAAMSKKHVTVRDVRNAIIYDPEAANILDIYISLGYGDMCASEMFH